MNTALFITLISLAYYGFLRFRADKEIDPTDDVPHVEVWPENDPVKFIHKERYGYYGKGARVYQEFWSWQSKKIKKELEK